MVAIEWARRHPRELAGVVVVNTSFRNLSPLFRRLSFAAWPLIFKIIGERDAAIREALILKMTSSAPDADNALVAKRAATFSQHPVRRINVFRQLLAAARYRPPKLKPEVPLLLLNSLGDRMVHPSCSEKICRHWKAERKTHPTAGHDLPLDDPDWCVEQVSGWLRESGHTRSDF